MSTSEAKKRECEKTSKKQNRERPRELGTWQLPQRVRKHPRLGMHGSFVCVLAPRSTPSRRGTTRACQLARAMLPDAAAATGPPRHLVRLACAVPPTRFDHPRACAVTGERGAGARLRKKCGQRERPRRRLARPLNGWYAPSVPRGERESRASGRGGERFEMANSRCGRRLQSKEWPCSSISSRPASPSFLVSWTSPGRRAAARSERSRSVGRVAVRGSDFAAAVRNDHRALSDV